MTAMQLHGSHLYYSLCQIEEIQPKANANRLLLAFFIPNIYRNVSKLTIL